MLHALCPLLATSSAGPECTQQDRKSPRSRTRHVSRSGAGCLRDNPHQPTVPSRKSRLGISCDSPTRTPNINPPGGGTADTRHGQYVSTPPLGAQHRPLKGTTGSQLMGVLVSSDYPAEPVPQADTQSKRPPPPVQAERVPLTMLSGEPSTACLLPWERSPHEGRAGACPLWSAAPTKQSIPSTRKPAGGQLCYLQHSSPN